MRFAVPMVKNTPATDNEQHHALKADFASKFPRFSETAFAEAYFVPFAIHPRALDPQP